MIRKLIVILFLCIPLFVSAEEFYVDNQGSDENSGTRSNPFRTLNHAAARAKAGDTVVIRAGTYRETLRFFHSGTITRPVMFMAAKGERVVISGADLVESWRPYKGSILMAKIPNAMELGFNQVFLDGMMVHQARFPNETSTDLHKPTLVEMSAGEDSIMSMLLSQPDGFWNGGFVVGGFGHRWSFQWARIKNHKAETLHLAEKSNPWFIGMGEGYLSGVLGALDSPGEWHIEDGVLYFWPPDGVDLARARIEVKQRALCIDFNKQSHVVIQGVDVRAGSVRLVGSSCTLENSEVSYVSHFNCFPWSGYAANGGADEGHNGILVQGDDNVIRGCTIQYSAGSGILIKGARNLVTRCLISDIDYSGTYSCPISLEKILDQTAGENRIWFNTIRRTGRDCIQMYGASADDICYNDISESGLLCKDLGMLYVWGRNGKGTRIAYNWVHDNRGKGPNPGIYLDNFCRNFIVDHNVIWNCEAGVRVNGPAEGHRVYNNTLFNCQDVGTCTYDSWPPPKEVTNEWPTWVYEYEKTNNLFLGHNPENQLQDVGSLKFCLKPSGDFVDAGIPIMGFTDGFRGMAPDLGAYETGGANWVPGKSGEAEQGAIKKNQVK